MSEQMILFDAAVQAIINGDANTLRHLLHEYPDLIKMRAPAEHHATLIHYVAANGVEDHLQITPHNAVEIAQILLDSGAVIDDTANYYGGGPNATPLIALVSSTHPAQAGVQADLVHLFCDHGAKVNGLDNDGAPLATALTFYYPLAAQALAECGARLDNPVFAAAVGSLRDVHKFFDKNGQLKPAKAQYTDLFHDTVTDARWISGMAFIKACLCGQVDVVQFFLSHGMDINNRPEHNRTGLHEAAHTGQHAVVAMLLEHGADVTVCESQHDATPAEWAAHAGHDDIARMIDDMDSES